MSTARVTGAKCPMITTVCPELLLLGSPVFVSPRVLSHVMIQVVSFHSQLHSLSSKGIVSSKN